MTSRHAASREPRVLVVYKKSTYQQLVNEQRNRRVRKLLAEGDRTVERFREAHEAHLRSVEATKRALRSLGVRHAFAYLETRRASARGFDLVVTLGGDGTLLWASHMVQAETPMLGLNTSPRDSVGYFCAGDTQNVEVMLSEALGGRLKATELARLRVRLRGKILSSRVLNDLLFCHECPAATSRYLLRHGAVEEDQKSSGIWVGPAAGSTAAQHSAGGRVLPIRSQQIQYVVREPYPVSKEYDLVRGLVEPGQVLSVRSKMPIAHVYIDGPHREHTVRFGEELRLDRSDEPLTLLGLTRRSRSASP